ncbi:MAG: uridine monophosphate kinase [Planctomycetota bacterium]
MSEPGYSRALLKLSGNAFADDAGIDRSRVRFISEELAGCREICDQIAVVVGAGNIMRGASFCETGNGRLRADHAGMMATAVNGLILLDCLEKMDIPASIYGAIPVPGVIPEFNSGEVQADLANGQVTVLAGGTGNPLFTTDTAAALRAIQVGADVLLKATRVDGVFSADPETSKDSEFFEHLSCAEVLRRRLKVMDLCAVSLCMQHQLPVRVLNYRTSGNIRRALAGESVGTLIGSPDHGHG